MVLSKPKGKTPADLSFVAAQQNQTAAVRKQLLSDRLINTRTLPAGFTGVQRLAEQARAYDRMMPYPIWQFQDWKTEDDGPLPTALPLTQSVVRKGAKWLFGKPLTITVPGNTDYEQYVTKAWQDNKMQTRMVAAARKGGIEGGIALKWSYDETAKPALSFQVLSIIDQCRLYFDPHDRDCLLMARVQYPIQNPVDGKFYMYREEWTDNWEVHYEPLPIQYVPQWIHFGSKRLQSGQIAVTMDNRESPDTTAQWKESYRVENPFGTIPLQAIKNIDDDDTWGCGDFWIGFTPQMFRVVDRIYLSYWHMDKGNQFDSEPNLVYIDVKEDNADLDRPAAPGQAKVLYSVEGGENQASRQGQVQMLEASGKIRPFISDYAHDLSQMIMDALGSVEIHQDEVTNKGNLTQAVLTQLYAPLIEATEEKRNTYGHDGIAAFLERCAQGLAYFARLKNLRDLLQKLGNINPDKEETYDTQIKFGDYFALTEEEKDSRSTRIKDNVSGGYLTHERGVEGIAKLEGVEDVGKLKDELKDVTAVVGKRQLQSNGPQETPPDSQKENSSHGE